MKIIKHITADGDNKSAKMKNAKLITALPLEVLHDILLEVEDVETLQAAVQSCKAFHHAFLAYSTTLRKVLEQKVPQPQLTYAYVLYRCEQGDFAALSERRKKLLLDAINGNLGRENYQHLFPSPRISWAEAFSISSFHKTVQSLAAGISELAVLHLGKASLKFGEGHKRQDASTRHVSEGEMLMVVLALYRMELYHQLFGTTRGAEPHYDLELYFIQSLEPWEVEQMNVMYSVLTSMVAGALHSVINFIHPDSAPGYQQFIENGYALSKGLLFIAELQALGPDAESCRDFVQNDIKSPLVETSSSGFLEAHFTVVNAFFDGVPTKSEARTPPENMNTGLGPYKALMAVNVDLETYYDGPAVLPMNFVRVYTAFYVFWDDKRIVEGNLVKLFARLAREPEPERHSTPADDLWLEASGLGPSTDEEWLQAPGLGPSEVAHWMG